MMGRVINGCCFREPGRVETGAKELDEYGPGASLLNLGFGLFKW